MKTFVTKTAKMTVCFFALWMVVLQFGYAANANAQLLTSLSNNLQTNNNQYYEVRLYSNSIAELRTKISIESKEKALGNVLKEISQKASLGIAFNSDLDVLSTPITASLSEVTVADALQYVLRETGYEAAISSTREILLIKDRAAVKPAENIEKEISGVVRDSETGETLPAVNVFVEGTNIGVTTDVNGEFELTVPDDAETLVFRFVGYITQEVPIGDQTYFEVALVYDLVQLEDAVVVGYGTQQRTEVTGAVSSVRTEEISGVPVSSFENALQGRMAGVNVAESTGEPGATPQITIRGTGSISAGNDPLYVVDGVPISKNTNLQSSIGSQRASFQPPKANPLATINPSDIESIEVLKDASAAAIYGSRGSNGVILITTKKGQSGTPQVSFDSYVGSSTVFNQPDLMNAEELIAYTKDSRNNNYLQDIEMGNTPANPDYDPDTNEGRPDVGNYLIPEQYVNWDGTDTDWLDLVFSPALMQNYDLSVAGGNEQTRYFLSAGFLNQEGVLDGSAFDRYTLKLNLTQDISEKFRVGTSINAALTQHDRLPANAPYFGSPPGIVYSALVHSPVVAPYNPDGTINQRNNQSYLGGGTTTASNPLAIMEFISEDIQNNRIFGNLYGDFQINDNLLFKSLVGYDLNNFKQSFFRGTEFLYRNQTEGQPYGQASNGDSFNWLWENTLNYTKTLAQDHDINAIVGYTAQKQTDETTVIVADEFPDDQVKTINGGLVSGGDELNSEWSLVSMLARVNYVFKDRYLFTGTIRSDRSSRFGRDNQTGVFPSFSLGWRTTQEPFMADQTLFSELKLRGSYGVTGNFEIPNYGSIGLLESANYPLGGTEGIGIAPQTLGDDGLTWETTYQYNLGVDYALWKSRIYGSFDVYNSQTEDLLLFVSLPASIGFETILTNIGKVENKGVEFSITSRNVSNKAFTWATDFNIAANRNKVLQLGPEGDPILSSGAAGQRHITRIGDPIGSYYGYVVDRVYQSQAEIDADNANAPGGDYDLMAPAPRPGDFRFKDINGDGVVNADDRTVIGSYHPDFTYGITNRFNYKGFDLSIFLQGVQGREVLNLTSRHLLNGEANFNSYAALNERWISESQPGNGEHPRADRNSAAHGNNNRISSYQVQDGSYLKIKNITLGYNFPPELIDGLFSSARIYVSATNVAMFTDYIGFNPEVSLQTNSLTPGEDYGAYPLSRTIQFGINLDF
ncbi:SusC/RagA family TonB-linked outer membrane protein [Gracilimonas tropica]|uniref:SusC/RagA family TonB-linked outer membrane protein n=1 Tax=Gracilimonas tropica TaxID=454600 RepID=UPI0012F8BCD8|nr:TonB-dependent receptor [Gracilimonas tropica]